MKQKPQHHGTFVSLVYGRMLCMSVTVSCKGIGRQQYSTRVVIKITNINSSDTAQYAAEATTTATDSASRQPLQHHYYSILL